MIIFILGRILLGGYFIYSGINHFLGHKGMVGYSKSKGVPMAEIAVPATGIMLVFGGLAIALGTFVTIGIWLLIVFLVITSFAMHQFWKIKDPMAQMPERINFLKNMALVGALLMLLALPLPWVYSIL